MERSAKGPGSSAAGLTPAHDLTLEPIDAATPEAPPRSRLRRGGHPTGASLDGRRLEAAFRDAAGRYLLLVTDDCPYEEVLHVYLRDAALEPLDGLELGAAYTGGALRNLAIVGPAELELSFFGDERYRLTILASPRRTLGRRPLPGVVRTGGLLDKRHLDLTLARAKPG